MNVAKVTVDTISAPTHNIEFPSIDMNMKLPDWSDFGKSPGLEDYPVLGAPNQSLEAQDRSSPSSVLSEPFTTSSVSSYSISSATELSTSSSSYSPTAVPTCDVAVVISGTSTKQVNSCTIINAYSATDRTITITQSCSDTNIVD